MPVMLNEAKTSRPRPELRGRGRGQLFEARPRPKPKLRDRGRGQNSGLETTMASSRLEDLTSLVYA